MEFNQVTSLFLAILVYLIGAYLVRRIRVLDRFSIPAPVVGGLLVAIVILVVHSTGFVTISFDTSLEELFMLIFFTTVGLGASFTLIKSGGKLLIIYLIGAGLLSLIQNTLGVSLASLLGIEPLLGLISSSPALIGGHGGATAFGNTMVDMGVDGALTVGISMATLGLVAGGLIGGPIARYLIKRNNLQHRIESDLETNELQDKEKEEKPSQNNLTALIIFTYLGIITFSMTLGAYLGDTFSELTGFTLPNYVGAMFVAIIVRSIIDLMQNKTDFKFDTTLNDLIGAVALGIFLAMALMSIQLWEIVDVALPLLAIFTVQIIFIVLFAVFVMYRVLGRDYDAAVMVSGLLGHGLGATPTAMANMDAVTARYGSSRTAFLIVPVVGAFLIDAINIPGIVFYLNLFG